MRERPGACDRSAGRPQAPAILFALGLLASCSSPTTLPGEDQAGGPTNDEISEVTIGLTGSVRELESVADVEQLVVAYGECVVDGIDDGAMTIQLDRRTGLVSGATTTARTEESLDRVDSAERACDQAFGFWVSLYTFAEAHPISREQEVLLLEEAAACIAAISPLAAAELERQKPGRIGDIDAIALATAGVEAPAAVIECVDFADGDWLDFGDKALLENIAR